MIGEAVYILCGLTSLTCFILLSRGYQRTRAKLLLWASLYFLCQTITNILLFVDLVLFPNLDIAIVRASVTFIGLLVLLYGLVWDAS
jgi:hypothetical protein